MEKLLAAVAQTHGFDDDDDDPLVSTPSDVGFDNSASSPVNRGEISGSRLIGEDSGDFRPSAEVERLPPAPASVISAAERVIGDGEKRKRGRPPKGQVAAKPPPPKRKKVEEEEEEDVCFICFDGGSLVLCDRKGCPKAYHPVCIKRDEEFFKSKSKWICGWHICRKCMKSSHYMCYMCTYSLCKGCTKDDEYLCVRGNKGFCSTCMKTIMLIENTDQATNEAAQLDFDDKTSFEYFFKMYWLALKENLSLTLSELMQAKNPWKGVPAVAHKAQFSSVRRAAVGGRVSNSFRSSADLELNKPPVENNLIQNDRSRTSISTCCNHVEGLNDDKGENAPSCNKDTIKPSTNKVTEETCIGKATDGPDINESAKEPIEEEQDDKNIVKDTNKPCSFKDTSDNGSNKPQLDCSQWASKDLLEFVAHMKNGDTTPVPQFDVQTLLLDYIKRNNLRDARRKSQIICDSRLKNLFRKPRVGHIEMLKLLELHFLIIEDSQKKSVIPAGFVSSVVSDVKVDRNTDELPKPINSRKRKTRRKTEAKTSQHDLNEYAAIDVHNISLIYLRRNLVENLLNDHENFNDNVIGSIVRIRVSTNDQKPEVFRLVQVVGTSNVVETYKIGDRTTNVMLEVLNLDKKEVVSIDAISNQEFTGDDCKRLRQIIRCGLVKPFTVGELQKIAVALQSAKVNDWLVAEVLRLNHLRDRASEKGRKKELRECVARLELLKSPEERQRRIFEVPEIHADPKMNPNYESEDDTRIGDKSKIDGHAGPCTFPYPRDRRKSIYPKKKSKDDRYNEALNRISEKSDASESHGLDKHMDQINVNSPATGSRNDQSMQRSGLETSTATASLGNSACADNLETEKLWHYRDPNGKIQGPFSMMQLRKWNTTGLFLPDMRIWTNHEQFDSLLLSDALNGKLYGTSDLLSKPASGSNENMATGEIAVSESTNKTNRDQKQTEGPCINSLSVLSEKNTGQVRADDPGSSDWPECWDLLRYSNSSANKVIARDLLPPSNPGKDVGLTDCGRASDELTHGSQSRKIDGVQESDELNHGSKIENTNSTGLIQNPIASELHIQSCNENRAVQSSEETVRCIDIDLSSKDTEMDSGPVPVPVPVPVSVTLDTSNQAENVAEDLGSPSPTLVIGNQQSLFVDVPVQDTGILELLSPPPRSNNEYQEGQATETKQSGFTIFPNTRPGWSGAPSLGIGALQIPEDGDPWCGYSPTPARQSIQEWDSDLVSAPSSKPPEVMNEYVDTLVPDSQHLTNASTSQQASTMPNWLTIMNEPIEFDALGEESVSDLLAEVDAMESRGALPSPTSALKFAREFLEDCKDDCFSSIEEFAPTAKPMKSDAFSSTTDLQLISQSSAQCKPIGSSPLDALDLFRSCVHSSASSEGETNAPTVHSRDADSEFHPSPNNVGQELVGATTTPGPGLDPTDPVWGPVQGNINLVTVQGNVNLVLVGPGQGMANIGWGTNPGTSWANPNASRSPRNTSLPWDGQRKYGVERFISPRERGHQGSDSGFGRGRAPWGRQQYGGGGYTRALPKGQRVCKFYESGHCKKGAFCDYLHP